MNRFARDVCDEAIPNRLPGEILVWTAREMRDGCFLCCSWAASTGDGSRAVVKGRIGSMHNIGTDAETKRGLKAGVWATERVE